MVSKVSWDRGLRNADQIGFREFFSAVFQVLGRVTGIGWGP